MGSIAFVGMDVHKATIAVAVAEGVRGGEVRQLGGSIHSARAATIGRSATGARYAGDTYPATLDCLKAESFTVPARGPFTVAVAATDSFDPFRIVQAQAHCGTIVGLPVKLRLPLAGFPPASGIGVRCPDTVVLVHDRVSGRTHQLRQFDWRSGSPLAGQYRSWDITVEGVSTKAASSLLNVSRVERARTVLREGTPELAAAVESGRVAVSTAAEIAREAPSGNGVLAWSWARWIPASARVG